MNASSFSLSTVGWVAIGTGVVGLLSAVFISLFYTVGAPFGTLNDVSNSLLGILTGLLAALLYNSIVIDRPIEEVFAFVGDLRNQTQWDPELLEMRRTTEGPAGIGTRYAGVRKAMGRKAPADIEFVAVDQRASAPARPAFSRLSHIYVILI